MSAVEPVEVAAPPGLPPLAEEEARKQRLAAMKRRATGLLVAVTVAFLLLALFGGDGTWAAYARAAAEGSMVGGLADWFAVTALFRHPLGIPIPHTAVIVERKDQFGRTLGDFVQRNLLTPEVVAARVRSSSVVARTGAWLADPVHAAKLAGDLVDAAVELAGFVRADDVERLVDEEIRRIVKAVPLAPLAGRTLRSLSAEGRDQELLDAVLPVVERALERHRELLRTRFREHSPRWIPGAVEDHIFDRLFSGVHGLLRDIAGDPAHPMRADFRQRLASFVERLETSPELRERGEQLKHDFLQRPDFERWSSSWWTELREALRGQAADPASEFRRRIGDMITAAGRRLRDDPVLAGKAEDALERAVRYVAVHFHDEIAGVVSTTVAQWDAAETSGKLELLLGRDLQFIRINGTVVGGLAGVLIHGAADLLR